MPLIDVTILAKGDPPPWDELMGNGGAVEHLDPETTWHIAILEHGMISGEPSLALALLVPDVEMEPVSDMFVIAETSIAALVTVLAAARAAFPEAFYDGPFDPRPLRTPGVN